MNTSMAALLATVLGPADAPEQPPLQKPASVTTEPSEAATEAAKSQPPPAEPTAEPAAADLASEATAEPASEPAPIESTPGEESTPAEANAEPPATPSEQLTVSVGSGGDGPPYYDEADAAAFRADSGVPDPAAPLPQARWRCLIADPTCGFNFEINATSAYEHRFQQGDVRSANARNWASGRAQYDVWANIPVLVEQEGRGKYTRMTLGPKGGVAFSDGGDLWGNLGMAARYWFGRGRWAPTLEFTSALSFKIGSRETRGLGGAKPKFEMTRGPVGFTADVGIGLGGFGALVVGGQYDSPLAREDVPEQFRVSAGGAFFIGFRGNILWGGPAAAAVLTHTLTQRYAEEAR